MGDVAGGGGGPMATFLVRWISSRTFREAMIRDRVLRGQMTDADAQAELAKPIDGYQDSRHRAGHDAVPKYGRKCVEDGRNANAEAL